MQFRRWLLQELKRDTADVANPFMEVMKNAKSLLGEFYHFDVKNPISLRHGSSPTCPRRRVEFFRHVFSAKFSWQKGRGWRHFPGEFHHALPVVTGGTVRADCVDRAMRGARPPRRSSKLQKNYPKILKIFFKKFRINPQFTKYPVTTNKKLNKNFGKTKNNSAANVRAKWWTG